eukprot:CAMPEP_0175056958 /NCGR_PEP_ID=MMETSP0052_2-20121109/10980_1 /TAXON_ID=51329 ORGANISM="Polytomella parva, Strain SAG 63-3" /NCGR_SAMPLE_ID=MMETSP0052_2 /ASSEMBLY_ACC=CAM_ASM_000194 /LENGTH=316 /DNA_ID=CAMNT_0016322083 /DNA_START=52 /DNA_END=1002 /DNA_ORIENTATION=+
MAAAAKNEGSALDLAASADGHKVQGKAKVSSSVLTELYTSGISVSIANTVTNPLDMIKVRMQLAGRNLAAGEKRPGMVSTGVNVVKNEGVLALWSGLGPSLARGFFFGGARLGLYTPIKMAIAGDEKAAASFQLKVLSGSLSGGLAAAVTSPIELIKTRLQAAGRDPALPNTSMGVIRSVVAADGVPGLWRGAMPGLIRSAILTACQCATYDEAKKFVKDTTGLNEGLYLHLSSSMIAGLVTTTVTNPIDVIKTRMFIGGKSTGGVMSTASTVLKNDGLAGFMKGWSASYARLGPHTVIMFLTAERLRSYAGLKNL